MSNPAQGSDMDATIDSLFNQFVPLIRKWKASDVGSLENWIGLLQKKFVAQ